MSAEPFGLENAEEFEASLVPDNPPSRAKRASSDNPSESSASKSASGSGRSADASAGASASRSGSGSTSRNRDQAYQRWIGKRLGRFRLMRLIGSGTMGVVFQAKDLNLHRITALKVLRRQIKGEDGTKQVERFLLEARTAAGLDHPSIAYVYEINEHAGWWFIAMEYLDGGDLRQLVKAEGPLAPGRAAIMLVDVANGLAAAHNANVIHRDIKPANLMLNRRGRCKVVDFGLVKLHSASNPFRNDDQTIIGTPYYVAPEVIRKRGAIPASDIYGLGATMHMLLTGRPPYLGQNVKEVLIKHLKADIPDVRERSPNCSESLAELIRNSLAKAPEDRPTAEELSAVLHTEAMAALADDPALSSSSSSLDASDLLASAASSTSTTVGSSSTQLTGLGGSTTAPPGVSVVPEASVTVAAASRWVSRHRWAAALGGVAVLGILGAWMLLSAGYEQQSQTPGTGGRTSIADLATETMINDIGMTLAQVPAGRFTMGSPPDEPDRNNDERLVEVSISNDFYMSVTEVTQGQWAAVMGADYSPVQQTSAAPVGGLRFVGDELPAAASWFEAAEFCRLLSARENKYYRLPTEAEWEYACRAGTSTRFHTGRGLSLAQANVDTEAFKSSRGSRPMPVASFPPNAWGLYDMHGNVMEWCSDWKADYSIGSLTDPRGPPDGSLRVIRGGSWHGFARIARSANRWGNHPTLRTDYLGFRVVLEPDVAPPTDTPSFLAAGTAARAINAARTDRFPVQRDALTLDAALVDYEPLATIDGRLHSIGSSTMDQLMRLWSEPFNRWHEQCELRHDGLGSSTAMPALTEGIAQLGPMSRPLSPPEIRAFQGERGYEPIQIRVGLDAVAIYVHPSNPIAGRGLTLAEVDAILSSTRNREHPQDISKWGDLSLPGVWADAPIQIYSPDPTSGMTDVIKTAVLLDGVFKPTTLEMFGSAEIVDAVSAAPHSIGLGSIGYARAVVAMVPLLNEEGSSAVAISPATVQDGSYPLTRPLFLTLDVSPEQAPAQEEFLRFIYSRQGQEQVIRAGFMPLSAALADQALRRAGVSVEP